ncbi:MAG: DNA/RNA nuclease SfsA [SAR324 cluster bacterium]|nr:DNA/RNA nuclease SfsA [SAR324 cluster bacterium]
MKLNKLVQGIFLKRYKRFFVDVQLANGEVVTAHSNNTGSMASLLHPGNPVWLEPNSNPRRKLKYTLHLLQVPSGARVCVNTIFPNQIVFDAIKAQQLPCFENCRGLKKEVRFGRENSRVDIYLENEGIPTFIEIKNVTLVEDFLPGVAQFPDARTERGRKHLQELSHEIKQGNRGIMLYLVNRTDCESFKIAEHIDPDYADSVKKARSAGVEFLVYQTKIQISQDQATIEIEKSLDMQSS